MPSEIKQEYIKPVDLLRRHEMRLYNLEKLYTEIKKENENSEFVTKKDLEILLLEKNLNNNSKYDNFFESNNEKFQH